jgi:squalene-associated FAD-dependent desaturase
VKIKSSLIAQNPHEVFIVGSGWSGLSSAIRLKQYGYSVQLFEATRQLGGRARCTKFKGLDLDNGQHILSGACHETLNLFQSLGMKEDDYLYRQSLKLDFLFSNKYTVKPKAIKELHLHPADLPAPFHLLFAFINARNITAIDKYHIIKLFIILRWKKYHIPGSEDLSLLEFLQKNHQSNEIVNIFWEPLCLAIMNTPVKIASTKIFLTVLKSSFTGNKQHSDILFFSTPLCESLPQNAAQFLQKKTAHIANLSSRIHLNSRIDSILIKNSRISGITIGQCEYACSRLILSTPVHITQKLLATHHECLALVKSLQKINYQPIYTIYLYYQQKFELPQYMTGILNAYSQWVFDKSFCQQSGLLAVIISGPGKHQNLNKDELIKQVSFELDSIFTLPKLAWGIVIKENKATINCSVTNNKYRPCSQTAIKGLYLAGDYTNTGYPSTLEGAVKSGNTAAELIINSSYG